MKAGCEAAGDRLNALESTLRKPLLAKNALMALMRACGRGGTRGRGQNDTNRL